MRPYKKRSFQSHLQSSENNVEAENSEDSEKQGGSPIMDDVEKDKQGETKKRKRWKRKISRKQFRHHDIKLFTPGEYRTSSLLKQKDTSPTVPKKSDIASKESITDLIVTSLGGQKQVSTQKKGQIEEVVDNSTKNDTEENNNTNSVQNNNNIGKHNLPAIIMETPSSVRRRSVDNINMSKPNFINVDSKFSRRKSVDMPTLDIPEKHLENSTTQTQIETITEETINVRNNGTIFISDNRANIEKETRNNITCNETNNPPVENVSQENLIFQEPVSNTSVTPSYLTRNLEYNGHLEPNNTTEMRSEPALEQDSEPMEIPVEDQNPEPENLSLKRRPSTETPVDLSKKNLVDHHHSNNYHQKIRHDNNENSMHDETSKNKNSFQEYQQSYSNSFDGESSSQVDYLEEYVKNNLTNHDRTSPEVRHPDVVYFTEGQAHPQDDIRPNVYVTDKVIKITNLNMWKEVLQRFLNQTFTPQVLDLMAHAYAQLEKCKEESCIPSELKLKTEKILSEGYSYISSKLKELNLDINPAMAIKILGQSENTPEKNTLKCYIENIQRIRMLAIGETSISACRTSIDELSQTISHLQQYRELIQSPPAYSIQRTQSRYHKNLVTESHIPNETPIKSNNHYNIATEHPALLSVRAEDHHVASNYSRGSSPRTVDYPKSVGHSMGSSPITADHQIPLELPSRPLRDYSISPTQSVEPSPRLSDHSISPGMPESPFGQLGGSFPRSVDYSLLHEQAKALSQRISEQRVRSRQPEETWLQAGKKPVQEDQFRRPSDHYRSPEHNSEASLRRNNHHSSMAFSEQPLALPSDHSVPLRYPYYPYFSPAAPKESIVKNSTQVGRPRSKSHRNMNSKINPQQHLRRSLSNPQNTLLTHPYLERVSNNGMPHSPRVPSNAYNLYPPSGTTLSTTVQSKELSVTPSITMAPKSKATSLHSEVFYRHLQNHTSKSNPLDISVHPDHGYQKKSSSTLPNIHRLEINENQREVPTMREVHQKTPKQHHVPKKPSIPLVTSSVEENISSSTDNLQISKVTNASKQLTSEKINLQDSIFPKQAETLKSIPVAVIVADKSMQITKETTATSEDERRNQASPPIDVSEDVDVRISISSNSNDNSPCIEENPKQVFDKEQDENNAEFLVWLEKLKSNEKLKSKFLRLIKKEEPIPSSDDPIEIIDSDEENLTEQKIGTDSTKISAENSSKSPDNQKSNQPKESVQIQLANKPNYTEKSPAHESPIQATPSTRSPKALEVNSVSKTPPIPKVIKVPSPRESLSKKDYIPPIPLPYIPSTEAQNIEYSPTSMSKNKKAIYSPEIEPISPVGNEPNFVFPDVPSGPKLLPPLTINRGERINVFPDNITSPTYFKRKNALDYPAYQNGEGNSHKTIVKRKKSLDRPEVTKSPRVAPSGKLCYVRESHMFLRYFDDTQVELFIRNLSTQDEELLRSTGIDPERLKTTHKPSNVGLDQLAKTEVIYLPRDVEFSEKEDIPDVEEFIKETNLVEQFVPKDFADFYRYVTGFQIIKNKDPVSLQTFLTMYNTNRTSELLRKYLARDEASSRAVEIRNVFKNL